jgi:hypothetical protein
MRRIDCRLLDSFRDRVDSWDQAISARAPRSARREAQGGGIQGGAEMAKAAALMALLLAAVPTTAMAKNTQFWNLTANTITSLHLSPAGKNDWGRDQTDNDSDHAVDHDERLKITGVTSGPYDVKFVDKSGRSCIVRNIPVKEGLIFSIEEKDLRDCSK